MNAVKISRIIEPGNSRALDRKIADIKVRHSGSDRGTDADKIYTRILCGEYPNVDRSR